MYGLGAAMNHIPPAVLFGVPGAPHRLQVTPEIIERVRRVLMAVRHNQALGLCNYSTAHQVFYALVALGEGPKDAVRGWAEARRATYEQLLQFLGARLAPAPGALMSLLSVAGSVCHRVGAHIGVHGLGIEYVPGADWHPTGCPTAESTCRDYCKGSTGSNKSPFDSAVIMNCQEPRSQEHNRDYHTTCGWEVKPGNPSGWTGADDPRIVQTTMGFQRDTGLCVDGAIGGETLGEILKHMKMSDAKGIFWNQHLTVDSDMPQDGGGGGGGGGGDPLPPAPKVLESNVPLIALAVIGVGAFLLLGGKGKASGAHKRAAAAYGGHPRSKRRRL